MDRRTGNGTTAVPIPAIFRFGTAEFDAGKFELRVSGKRVAIQPKPLTILQILLLGDGNTIAKDTLLKQVWKGRPTVDNVLPNAVTKLRGALGDENAVHVISQPRIGYRLMGPVERIYSGQSSSLHEIRIAGSADYQRGVRTLLDWNDSGHVLASAPMTQRLQLCLHIANAVMDAHQAGAIHLNLNAENILIFNSTTHCWRVGIDSVGHAVVSGIGIYSAPELLMGKSPSKQCDLYSLGVLIYQICSGNLRKPLAQGWKRDIGHPALRKLIARATDGDPKWRSARIEEVIDALANVKPAACNNPQHEPHLPNHHSMAF